MPSNISQVQLPPAIGRAIPVARIPRATLCPVAELFDLVAHQLAERDNLGQGGADCQLAGFSVFVEGQVEGFDEGLLDLGAGEPLGGVREADGVVVERKSDSWPFQM